MLMTEHNLWFYQRLMAELRDGDRGGPAGRLRGVFRSRYRNGRGAE